MYLLTWGGGGVLPSNEAAEVRVETDVKTTVVKWFLRLSGYRALNYRGEVKLRCRFKDVQENKME